MTDTQITATEKLRKILIPFNIALIASEANVCPVTLSMFRHGKNKTITADNYIKVKAVLSKIANEIQEAKHD